MSEILLYAILGLLIVDLIIILYILIRKIYLLVFMHFKNKVRHKVNKLLETSTLLNKRIDDNSPPFIKMLSLSRFEKRVLEELVNEIYDFSNEDERYILYQIIEHLAIVDKQIKILKNRVWWNKANAAHMLGIFGVERSIPALLKQLNKTKNREVKFKCGEAIVKISGSRHLKTVLTTLSKLNEKNHKQLIDIIILNKDDCYDELMEIFGQNNKEHIMICLEILGQKKDKRIIPFIKDCLQNGSQELIITALKASEKIGYINDEEYLNILFELKTNKNWVIRSFLAKTLMHFDDIRTYDVLSDLMMDTKWRVRYNAATSLSKMGAEGLNTLSYLLFSKDRFAQDMAWQLLHKEKEINLFRTFKDYEMNIKMQVEQNMIRYITNKEIDSEYQYTIIKKGENHKNKDLIEIIANGKYNKIKVYDWYEKEKYGCINIDISGKSETVNVLPIIKSYLRSNNDEFIIIALKAGGNIGYIYDRDYLDMLLELSIHKNGDIRNHLAILLQHFDDSRVYTCLMQLMKDPVRIVRNSAGKSLNMMGSKGFIYLSKMLSSEDNFAKELALSFINGTR